MDQSCEDSCFVKIDFMKAFDNVHHKYFEKLLECMKFPCKFIRCFLSLYKNCTSVLIINGMVSKKIRIKSGFRQGDPLSKDLFNLGLNPLIKTLNNSKDIEKYKTMSNQSFLTLAFVDDLNLLIRFICCLVNALKIFAKFKIISGFTINLEKNTRLFLQ